MKAYGKVVNAQFTGTTELSGCQFSVRREKNITDPVFILKILPREFATIYDLLWIYRETSPTPNLRGYNTKV